MIKHLTTSCPHLEEFSVQNCYGFKRFCVYGLQKLQRVEIRFGHGLERIDIEAPNLFYLMLINFEKTRAPFMNLASCKKLTTLYYCGYPTLTSKGLVDFSSNFPFLTKLILKLPDECNNLKLSSNSLRAFNLCTKCDLEEIDISTPKLSTFVFTRRSGVPSRTGGCRSLAMGGMDPTEPPKFNDILL